MDIVIKSKGELPGTFCPLWSGQFGDESRLALHFNLASQAGASRKLGTPYQRASSDAYTGFLLSHQGHHHCCNMEGGLQASLFILG